MARVPTRAEHLRGKVAALPPEIRDQVIAWANGYGAEFCGGAKTADWDDRALDALSARIVMADAARHAPGWETMRPDQQALCVAVAAELGLPMWPIDRDFASEFDNELAELVDAVAAAAPIATEWTSKRIAAVIGLATANGVATVEDWLAAVRTPSDDLDTAPTRVAAPEPEPEPKPEPGSGDRLAAILEIAYAIRSQVDDLAATIEQTIEQGEN